MLFKIGICYAQDHCDNHSCMPHTSNYLITGIQYKVHEKLICVHITINKLHKHSIHVSCNGIPQNGFDDDHCNSYDDNKYGSKDGNTGGNIHEVYDGGKGIH